MIHSFYETNKEQDLALKLNTYYFRNNKGTVTPMHQHNRTEFMYVLNGHCTVNGPSHTYELSKGQVIFIDANVEHDLILPKDSPCRIINLEFTFTPNESVFPSFYKLLASDRQFDRFLQEKRPIMVMTDRGTLVDLMKQIIISREGADNTLKLQLLTMQFVLEFVDLYNFRTGPASDDYIEKVNHYLYTHYDQPIKVADIAEDIHLNENYLQRLYKQKMKMTLLDHLHEIRLNQATRLLETTHYSILEISELVGYNTRQYFTDRFKRHYGLSPKSYREQDIESRRINH